MGSGAVRARREGSTRGDEEREESVRGVTCHVTATVLGREKAKSRQQPGCSTKVPGLYRPFTPSRGRPGSEDMPVPLSHISFYIIFLLSRSNNTSQHQEVVPIPSLCSSGGGAHSFPLLFVVLATL